MRHAARFAHKLLTESIFSQMILRDLAKSKLLTAKLRRLMSAAALANHQHQHQQQYRQNQPFHSNRDWGVSAEQIFSGW
jgi:hypothetical protein